MELARLTSIHHRVLTRTNIGEGSCRRPINDIIRDVRIDCLYCRACHRLFGVVVVFHNHRSLDNITLGRNSTNSGRSRTGHSRSAPGIASNRGTSRRTARNSPRSRLTQSHVYRRGCSRALTTRNSGTIHLQWSTLNSDRGASRRSKGKRRILYTGSGIYDCFGIRFTTRRRSRRSRTAVKGP